MAATSPGIFNTTGITSLGSMTVKFDNNFKNSFEEYLYGRSINQKIYVAPPAPPVQRESLDLYERMMTGPRPVPDYPIPLFVGDYVNGIILPADWDPNGHMEGEGTWQNRTRFFSEGRLWNYKRIPLAPRFPGS